MARSNQGGAIYADDLDRRTWMETLAEACEKTGWRVHAYVLMGNHYHLIAETHRANLGRWMHWLTTAYSVISTDAIVRWDIFFKEDTRASCNR